jgi:hypothetical protein
MQWSVIAKVAARAHARLTEYEDNGDDRVKGDWAAFNATVSSRGFRGQTALWVSRTDLEAFVTALTALDESLNGVAELVCGVGTDEHLRLLVEAHGKSGRLAAHTLLSEPREPPGQRGHAEFTILPRDLTGFRIALRRVLKLRLGEARLVGDPEQAL